MADHQPEVARLGQGDQLAGVGDRVGDGLLDIGVLAGLEGALGHGVVGARGDDDHHGAHGRVVEDVRDAESELEDRYGAPPVTVLNLIAKHRLRVRLEPKKLTYFGLRGDHVLLKFTDRELVASSLISARERLRILTDKSAHLLLPESVRTPDQVVDHAEQLFA